MDASGLRTMLCPPPDPTTSVALGKPAPCNAWDDRKAVKQCKRTLSDEFCRGVVLGVAPDHDALDDVLGAEALGRRHHRARLRLVERRSELGKRRRLWSHINTHRISEQAS